MRVRRRLRGFVAIGVAVAAALATMITPVSAGSTATKVFSTQRRSEEWASAATGYLAVSQRRSVFRPGHVLLVPDAGGRIRVNRDGTNADLPTIELANPHLGDALLFSQWRRSGDRDIKVYDVAGGGLSNPPPRVNTDVSETRPTLSGDHLLFARGPVARPLKRIVLYDLATQTPTILERDFYVWPGLVNGDWVVYQHCAHDCSIVRYQISTEQRTNVPTPNRGVTYFPVIDEDGTVYFAVSGRRCGQNVRLMRHVPGAGSSSRIERFPDGIDIFPSDVFGGEVYFGRLDCRRERGDIYKLTP